jgi:predicted kinase
MAQTLILFSGLPGCGKTTLARGLAEQRQIPLFAKDRVQRVLRDHVAEAGAADGYHLLLDLADEQLGLKLSVILDAVFPLPGFRQTAQEIAARHAVRFFPVCCFCSDEGVWRERMGERRQYVPGWTPLGWEEVERLRPIYQPWAPGEALFLDACEAPERNLARLVAALDG